MAKFDSRQGRHWRDHVQPAVLRRDGRQCRLRLPGCTGVATQGDHVIPKSLGGPDTMDNAVAACAHCNQSKGNGRRQRGPVFSWRGVNTETLDKISTHSERRLPIAGDYSRKPAESAHGPRRAPISRAGTRRS